MIETGTRTKHRIAILAGLLFCPVAFAQSSTRTITGTVQDRQHEPLRGAIVQVQNEANNSLVTYITERAGHYSFKRLSGETDYHLWATFRGHESRHKELSHFDSKQDKTIVLVIRLE